jgi:hypothetical protein
MKNHVGCEKRARALTPVGGHSLIAYARRQLSAKLPRDATAPIKVPTMLRLVRKRPRRP